MHFLTTFYIAASSYLALGEPRALFTVAGSKGCTHQLNKLQQKMVAERRKDIGVFLSAGEAGGELHGKSASIADLLEACQCKYGKPPVRGEDEGPPRSKELQTPLPIVPDYMSLPKQGATKRLIERLSPFLALAQIRPELLQRPRPSRPLPKPRMHGKPSGNLGYLRGLHVRGMAALAHPSWIPAAGDGLPVNPAGAFGVPKSDSTPARPRQRAITNRMPRNATQYPIQSANLPHGTVFTKIILPPDHYARVSMDDLPDYFHNLREEDASALNNHMGRTYKVEELLAAGFILNELAKQAGILQIVLIALPMGSIHAVDYSQDFHEGMLLDSGVVGYADLLHYGCPVERWGEGERTVFHGVYIDDNGIVGIVPKDVALQGLADVDTVRAADCDRAYRACDFPPKLEKRVRHRVSGGCVWGGSDRRGRACLGRGQISPSVG